MFTSRVFNNRYRLLRNKLIDQLVIALPPDLCRAEGPGFESYSTINFSSLHFTPYCSVPFLTLPLAHEDWHSKVKIDCQPKKGKIKIITNLKQNYYRFEKRGNFKVFLKLTFLLVKNPQKQIKNKT